MKLETQESGRKRAHAIRTRVRRKAYRAATGICVGLVVVVAAGLGSLVLWLGPKWSLVEPWWAAITFAAVLICGIFGVNARGWHLKPKLEASLSHSWLKAELQEADLLPYFDESE